MQHNKKHSRNSRFIMVQLDEDLDAAARSAGGETPAAAKKAITFLTGLGAPHRLSELGKERLRRTGAKIRAEAPEGGAAPSDTGFRVFRLGDARGDADELFFRALLDCGLSLDIAYETAQTGGVRIYTAEGNTLAACFAPVIPEAVLRMIAEKGAKRCALCVRSRTGEGENAAKRMKALSPETQVSPCYGRISGRII